MSDTMTNAPFFRWFRPFLPDFEDMQTGNLTMTGGFDVYEENDQVIVKAPIPGIPPDKVDVTYEDGVLRIRAQKEEPQEGAQKKKTVYRKNRITSYDYTTTLPRPINEKSLDANVENGIVTVTADIAPEAKPRKIAVKTKSK